MFLQSESGQFTSCHLHGEASPPIRVIRSNSEFTHDQCFGPLLPNITLAVVQLEEFVEYLPSRLYFTFEVSKPVIIVGGRGEACAYASRWSLKEVDRFEKKPGKCTLSHCASTLGISN